MIKQNKQLVIAAIVVIIVILILRMIKKKSQESGFVQPRGFFPGAGGTTPAGGAITPMPAPAPTPMPAPMPEPAPEPAPGAVMSIDASVSQPTPPPPPPSHHHPHRCGGIGQPPCYPPYPYGGYPVYYYDPFPRTYFIEQAAAKEDCYKRVILNTEAGPKDACLNKAQYIEYLRNRIRGLEIAYDEAMSDLMLNVAWIISRQIKKAKRELSRESIVLV